MIGDKATEKQKQLIRLAREIGDTDKELLLKVRGMLPGVREWGVLTYAKKQLNDLHFLLGILEHEVMKMEVGKPTRLEFLIQKMMDLAPFKISLDNMDSVDGSVTVYTRLKEMAKHDQSINGAMWEAPGDLDVAYACIMDEPGLVQKLEAEGYVVDEDDYCRSDSWDELRENNPEMEVV